MEILDLDNRITLKDNTEIRARLDNGEYVCRVSQGKSMVGIIEKGETMLIEPLDHYEQIAIGDVVACIISNPNTREANSGPKYYYHLVAAINDDGSALIANNHGYENGLARREDIFGRVIAVLDNSTEV